MFTKKKILCVVGVFVLAACNALPSGAAVKPARPEKTESPHFEASQPVRPLPESASLEESVPAVVWKDSSQGNLLVPIDPFNGQASPGYEPISLGQASFQAYSPDGHTLAAIGFVSGTHPNGGSLHLIDLSTWQEQVQELRLDSYVDAMAFSPDGHQLAIAYGDQDSRVLVIDVSQPFDKTKSTSREASLNFYVYNMRFSVGSSKLLVYGSKIENRYTVNETSPDPPLAVLLDSSDLSVLWKASLQGVHQGILPKEGNGVATPDLTQPGQAIYLYPGVAFAPDSDVLYLVHADEDKLTTVDFNAKKVTTLNIKPQLSWFERLLSLGVINAHAKVAEGTRKDVVISLDGKFLYVVGQRSELGKTTGNETQVNTIPLSLQIIRTKDGNRVANYDTEAQELSVSADGRYLYLRSWGVSPDVAVTQIFDTSSDRFISRLNGMFLVPTRQVDGKPILGSSVWLENKQIYHNSIIAPQDLSVLTDWQGTDSLFWIKTP